jgi:hypothetical protein
VKSSTKAKAKTFASQLSPSRSVDPDILADIINNMTYNRRSLRTTRKPDRLTF